MVLDQIAGTLRTLPSVPELFIWADNAPLPTGHYPEQIDGDSLAQRGEAIVVISDARMHRQIVTETADILCSQPEATL